MSCAAERGDFPAWPRKVAPEEGAPPPLQSATPLERYVAKRPHYRVRRDKRKLTDEQVGRLRAAKRGDVPALLVEFAAGRPPISLVSAWKIRTGLTYRDLP